MKRYYDMLRELRTDRDLTQKEVAGALGIHQQVYSRYELGIRPLPIELLIKLCKYYIVSADFILRFDLKPDASLSNNSTCF